MSLYWTKYTYMDSTIVGHPMGTLQQIQYLNRFGLPYNASTEAKINTWKKYEPYSEVLNYTDSSGLSAKPRLNVPLYHNWSIANIEVPYHCSTCNSLIPYEGDECDECSPHYIH